MSWSVSNILALGAYPDILAPISLIVLVMYVLSLSRLSNQNQWLGEATWMVKNFALEWRRRTERRTKMYENGRHIYFILYSIATQIRQKFSFTFKFYRLDTTSRFNNSSRTFSGAFLILFMTMRKRKRGAKKSPPLKKKKNRFTKSRRYFVFFSRFTNNMFSPKNERFL